MHFSLSYHCAMVGIVLLCCRADAQDSMDVTRIAVTGSRVDCGFRVKSVSGAYMPVDAHTIAAVDNGAQVPLADCDCPPADAIQPFSVVLALDVSGSMEGRGWEGVKAAASAFIREMDGLADETGLIVFSSTVTTLHHLSKDRDSLLGALETISYGGSTALWDASVSAIGMLQAHASNPNQAVVVLTDGVSSSDTYTPGDVITLGRRHRIRVCAIGAGPIQSDLHNWVAAATGGVFHALQSFDAATSALLEILQRMRTGFEECRATWILPCADGAAHDVELRARVADATLSARTSYRAPLDTAGFTPMAIALLSVPAPGQSCSVPLALEEPSVAGPLAPFQAAFTFDTARCAFIDADFHEAALDPAGTTVTAHGDSVILRSDKGSGHPRPLLLTLRFSLRNPPDGTRLPLRWAYWRFAHGCHSPVLQDGMIVEENVAASIVCEGPPHPCPGDTIRLAASPGLSAYRWNSGDTSRTIEVASPGPWRYTATTGSGAAVASPIFTVPYTLVETPRILCEGIPFLCDSGTVTLSVSGGYAAYRWSTGDTTAALRVVAPGAYAVEVADSLGCTALSDTIAIQSGPFPSSLVDGPRVVCAGIPSRYYAPAYEGVTYRWETTGGEILTDPFSRSVTVRWTAGDDSLRLFIATVHSGCSGSALIGIHARPVIRPRIAILGDSVACRSDSIWLEASDGYESYLWSTGAVTRRCLVPYPGGRFHVRATTRDGCVAVSDTVRVVLLPTPSAYFVMNGNVCAGSEQSYRIYDPVDRCSWEVEGGSIVAGEDSIEVRVRWGEGDSGALTARAWKSICASSFRDVVTIRHPVQVRIRYNPDSVICEHGFTSLDAGEGFKEYRWSDGVTGRYRLARVQRWYAVTATDQFGCSTSTDSVFVTVLPAPPVPSITRIGNVLYCDSASTYQWYRDDAPVPAPQGRARSLELSGPGVYYVIIHDERGCWEMSQRVTVDDLSGAGGETAYALSLAVSPNPNSGRFTVYLPSAPAAYGYLTIHDRLGRRVLGKAVSAGTLSVNVSDPTLAAGLYMIEYRSGAERQTRNMVVIK